MTIYEDGINDIYEIYEQLKEIRIMSSDDLRKEQKYYLDSIKALNIRANKQYFILFFLHIALSLNVLSDKYRKSVDTCMEEVICEKNYLYLYKLLIKKRLVKKIYDNTDEIFLGLVNINTIGNNREMYTSLLCNEMNSKSEETIEKTNQIYSDDENGILIKKLFKNIK